MANGLADKDGIGGLRAALLAWYERSRRDLPWRRTRDPYAIWVSEIMLQQTRVAVVVERYREFMRRFPTVLALAGAPEQEVLALWSGLGYYRRARMLHKAAQVVAAGAQGIPETSAGLLALPGVGAYTAAAVASIAFGERVAAVDGNVERVLCRLRGWHAKGGHARNLEKLAARLVDEHRPGDFNQAMMELGATVCLPRNPQCLLCPIAECCKTRGEHKTKPRARPVVREIGYALSVRGAAHSRSQEAGEVLLEQRPPGISVMPGMWELPALRQPPGREVRMTVRHAIMNVNYVVRIREVREEHLDEVTVAAGERRWVPLREAGGMALTGLARKVLKGAHLLSEIPAAP
jgi:A/G-specific adenine glycosylase